MTDEMINRQVIKRLEYERDHQESEEVKEAIGIAIEAIRKQIPDGEWTSEYDENASPFLRRKFRCSACGESNTYGRPLYCPKCGKRMAVEK